MKQIAYIAELTGSLTLTKNAGWYHNGVLFQNKKLSDLFLRSVVWDETEKKYYIEIGNQRATFAHEGCVYFGLTIDDSKIPWVITLSTGEKAALDPKTLCLEPDDAISCEIEGKHRVRFLRAAHQTLVQHVTGEQNIQIDGTNFTIQKVSR